MAYRFKRKESVPDGVRRIVAEETRGAARELECEGEALHEGIHEARKSIKKTRSLLRLLRGALGKEVYRQENRRLRQTARRLSGVRDTAAMVEAVDKLVEAEPDAAGDATVAAVRAVLVHHRQAAVDNPGDLEDRARESAGELARTPERAAGWRLRRKGFAALAPGYRRAYKRGRKAFRKAAGSGDDHRFHQWRKRVKDHWYHTRLVRRAWPGGLEPRVDGLKRLADLLGDDHDLAVLRERLAADDQVSRHGAKRVARLAARRQQRLRAEAEALGRRLYAAKPKCRKGETAALWQAWRGGR
jgi:CHAD domain-containing protein